MSSKFPNRKALGDFSKCNFRRLVGLNSCHCRQGNEWMEDEEVKQLSVKCFLRSFLEDEHKGRAINEDSGLTEVLLF